MRISTQTVKNRLHEIGLNARSPAIRISLTRQHAQNWLDFAKLTSDGRFMTGRQCYSLMSTNSVSILLIDVSWCGESPNRDLMN